MHSRVRSHGWVVTLSLVILAAVSLRATEPWASSDALGDVVVSFDNAVRVYGNTDGLQKGPDIGVPGSNRGLAFDGSLNLLVANSNAAATPVHAVVTLDAVTHAPGATRIATPNHPQSIVFAGDGSYYVASRVSATQAVIRRFSGTAFTDFSMTVASSGTCLGIDLDAGQQILYIVDGATNPQPRLVRTMNVVTGAQGQLANAIPGNGGSACGIRALPPQRHAGASATNGGFLVADRIDIKRLTGTGVQVGTGYTTGTNSTSDNRWIDVDLDPNAFHFWGLDGGELRAAKFRIGAPTAPVVTAISNLPGVPRGLTLNGALRAAQTTRLLTLAPGVATRVTYLPGTEYSHDYQLKLPVSATVAVQAVEGRSDGTPQGNPDLNGICPTSLDIDCRISELFPAATARPYSRERAVFYSATELTTLPPDAATEIGVVFAADSPTTGAACVPGGSTQPAVALLRDPFPHTHPDSLPGYSTFTNDITVLVYSKSLGTVGRTLNHYVVVNRSDTLFNAYLLKPPPTDQQIGSTMQVAVEVRDPATGCSVVSGLVGTMALSISDVTAGKLVVDTEQVGGTILANGLQFVASAGQYRANVYLAPALFRAGNTHRVCVNARAGYLADPNARAIGDVCQDFRIVAGKGKTK